MKSKLKSAAEAAKIIARLKKQGKRVVFTNGCFDILHVGHVEYLSRARKMGNALVIGLNGDISVRSLKGKGRPVNNEKDRAKVLSALGFVDHIVIFNEDTPEKLIRKLVPDVLVKGADWKNKTVSGVDFIRSRGGKVIFIPFVSGYSTTSILKRIARD
ncbi:MAG: D-glycero-beta-D-manno-heptose 1-phosphate adenylyltransferase [Candidatus Omnitrophica bacterium]|nr:D-glycero-beta-D-manno-heptose 1-phosphate adenylyltransferase [Dehalococcoidales bacterium]MDD5428804.1 D-glycero-beta-D-manno-heptose 1-phosphate adenylyltransferase [Candidatus Omnitrophota bacterium]